MVSWYKSFVWRFSMKKFRKSFYLHKMRLQHNAKQNVVHSLKQLKKTGLPVRYIPASCCMVQYIPTLFYLSNALVYFRISTLYFIDEPLYINIADYIAFRHLHTNILHIYSF